MARLPYITHGPTTSFILCFVAWLSCVAMPAIETQATLKYLSVYFPSLSHLASDGSRSLSHLGTVAAGVLMLGFTGLNLLQSKSLARDLFTIPTGGIAFSFIGFRHSIDLAGESRHPHIGIPMAILGSIVTCILLYKLLQLAFNLELPPKLSDHGWALLKLGSHDSGPLIALATLVGASWLIGFILTKAIASPMGAGLTYMTSSARMSYTISQNHQFQKFLHISISTIRHLEQYFLIIFSAW